MPRGDGTGPRSQGQGSGKGKRGSGSAQRCRQNTQPGTSDNPVNAANRGKGKGRNNRSGSIGNNS